MYRITNEIEEGGSAHIYKAVCYVCCGKPECICKQDKKKYFVLKIYKEEFCCNIIKSERNIIKHLCGIPNILHEFKLIKLQNVTNPPFGLKDNKPIAVMPFYKDNLSNFVSKNRYYFRSNHKLFVKLTRDLLKSINMMHNKGVIHGDLHTKNIVLDIDCYEKIQKMVLIDFGNSFGKHEMLKYIDKNLCTYDHRAPERFEKKKFDCKIDIYAFACVMYHIYTGKSLFGHLPYENKCLYIRRNYKNLLKNIKNDDLKELLIGMLKYDKDQRFSFEDCMNSKFFKEKVHKWKSRIIKENNTRCIVYNDRFKINIVKEKMKKMFFSTLNNKRYLFCNIEKEKKNGGNKINCI